MQDLIDHTPPEFLRQKFFLKFSCFGCDRFISSLYSCQRSAAIALSSPTMTQSVTALGLEIEPYLMSPVSSKDTAPSEKSSGVSSDFEESSHGISVSGGQLVGTCHLCHSRT